MTVFLFSNATGIQNPCRDLWVSEEADRKTRQKPEPSPLFCSLSAGGRRSRRIDPGHGVICAGEQLGIMQH